MAVRERVTAREATAREFEAQGEGERQREEEIERERERGGVGREGERRGRTGECTVEPV